MKQVTGIHILLGGKAIGSYSPNTLAEIAIEGGANVIQLREKEMRIEELLPVARQLREICRDTTFIINDRADLAKIVEADGVHLGQDDLPLQYAREILGDKRMIGISCNSIEHAQQAEKEGADYIGFGHLFPTSSKFKTTLPKSIEELQAVCASVGIPVIAIGGITPKNAQEILRVPIGGIAILGAFSRAENPKAELEMLARLRTYE